MLTFYVSSGTDQVARTIGRSLRSFTPKPAHRFKTWQNEVPPPEPEPGELVMVCGATPLSALQAKGYAPKNRTVTTLRETPIARNGGHYLVTFCPSLIQVQPEKREIIDWDVRLAHRLLTTGSLKPKVGDYAWVADYVQVIAEIEAEHAKTGRPVKVSMDTETMGLYPQYPDKDVVSISFTHRPGVSKMLYLGTVQAHPVALGPNIIAQIDWLLNSPKVRLRGANLKFDLIWIKEKWGLDCTNFKFDTLLAGSLVDENRSNSMNLQAKLFTDFGGYDDAFNAKYDKNKMEQVPVEDLRVYAGGDTDAAYRVADVLQAELDADPELKRFYVTILHPAARAFEKIERRGILVDPHKFAVLRDDLKAAIKESTNKQLSLLPGKMRYKYMDRIDDQLAEGKNPMLPSILNEYFFTAHGLNLKPQTLTPKDKKPSLTKAHLRAVAEGHPEAMAMIKEMTIGDTAAKTLSTFVEGFLKHLRPDGRFHPSYMLFHGGYADGSDEDDEAGTVTGRLSAKEPAIQTVPKKKPKFGINWAKRLRECYIAPPGKVVFIIDYIQGELKVVACCAPEPTMIASYQQGFDLHAVTGAKLAGVEFKQFLSWKDSESADLSALYEKHRDDAKPANFGLLYGQSARGFQVYAWKAYGLKLTLEEAEKMRNAFFELYPGLLAFHARQTNLVGLHQAVRSPLGRLRHLPTIKSPDSKTRSKAERQAINSPIQSTLADMMEWAIALIDVEFPNEEVQIVGNIHDAIFGYVDEDKVDALLPQVMQIMSNLPLHQLNWHPPLQFTVDAQLGKNLAELTKFKLAA